MTNDFQRIALIKPSALGDLAHALPVAHALRMRFPQAHITWVVNRTYAPLLAGQPDIDAVLPFDRGVMKQGLIAGASASWAFGRQLRAARFDLAIDLQCLLRTGLMALATTARTRIGLDSAREGARFCYTHAVRDDRQAHAVDRYWRVAELLGAGEGPKRFRLALDPTAQAWALQQLAGLPKPWLAVGVGARWLTKRWPPAHFAELANLAHARTGASAVFVGTPDETELADAALAGVTGPAINLCGRTSLPQLAAVLAACDAMLGNDTGPLHLAVALGRPVVAPYLCTSARRHGPYNQPGGVETRVGCAASYRRRCSHLSCMNELQPARLADALLRELAAWPHRQSA